MSPTALRRNRLAHALVGVAALVLLATLAGCSRPAWPTVRGQVTVDGKLLDSGEIQFQPTGGIGPTGGGRIEKGRYEARLSPGAKTVRIRGYEQVGVGHYSNGGEYPIRRQFLPARYNDATTLEAMIGPDRSQVNFALESR